MPYILEKTITTEMGTPVEREFAVFPDGRVYERSTGGTLRSVHDQALAALIFEEAVQAIQADVAKKEEALHRAQARQAKAQAVRRALDVGINPKAAR